MSGQSFFSGVALLVVAALASTRTMPIFRRVTVLSFLIGAIAVVVSSTAIPYWYYAVAVTVTLTWIASRFKKEWQRHAAFTMAGIWLIAALFELPHHITYSLEPAKTRTLAVIGDSVTAGVDGDETSDTWPGLLARQHQVEVQDISHIGETAASALKRVQSQSMESSVVVVEIGGNDIVTSAHFCTVARYRPPPAVM